MHAVVLETDVLGPGLQTKYDDSLTSYQFPRRYLSQFHPLSEGHDMLAVIYEPRGRESKGRMAYVGWATLRGAPRRESIESEDLYRVDCVEPMRAFERPVPREIRGQPLERWLRYKARGRDRNIATLGKAVRALSGHEVEDIFRLGATDVAWDAEVVEESDGPDSSEDRPKGIVEQVMRSERFKDDVLSAYGYRCAVSELSSQGMGGLVEAAHIRGAGRPHCGPDHITNGIAMTPTLHRLFDRHLFSFRYEGNELVVVTSNQLSVNMVENTMTGSRLALTNGQEVRLPREASAQPCRRFIDYHRHQLRT